jgi:hypothetical protein
MTIEYYKQKRFNIIGFTNTEPKEYKHCIFCTGRRLQPDPHDDSKLMCFSCGYSVLVQDAPNEEGISVKHGKQQTAIVSGKRKKKHFDSWGTEITDPDLIDEIQRGNTVISYREDLPK